MQSIDSALLARLLEEHWPQAYRIAWTILKNPAEAQDAAQEACAHVLRSTEQLRSSEAFRGWFYRIVVNEARGRLRRRSFEALVDDVSLPSDPIDDRIDVRRAIERLDAMDRLAIVLFYYIELPTAEIARVMRVTPLAIRLRLMNARRRLRPLLELGSVDDERNTNERQLAN